MHQQVVGERKVGQQFLMAGYRYEIRSYNTYSGVAPVAEKWKKPMYAESDHGMDQPSGSTESYLVKSERIFEQVHTSNVTDGVERNGWDRPRKVEDFITQVQTQPRPHLLRQGARQPLGVPIPSPSPDYKHNRYSSSEPASDRWSRSSSPIRDPVLEGNSKVQPLTRPGFLGDGTRAVYSPAAASDTDPSSENNNNNTWGRPVGGRAGNMSPVAEYKHSSNSPSKDHVTENNPSRPGLLRSANWRQSPNSPAAYESCREMDKGRPGGHSDYSAPEKYPVEASPQRGGGTNWTRAGRGGRPLTRPTNNIKEAVNYLAGALQQQQQFYETKMDHYTETIDSSDAQSRYGKLSGSSRETYSTTIDSREAVRKYCGAAI